MTSYIWDIAGYAPNLMSLMMGDKIVDIARYMAAIDLERYNAFAPDGTGTGVSYAYSTVSFAALVYAAPAAATWPDHLPSTRVLSALLALALMCTALAFIVFFALIREVGAISDQSRKAVPH